MKISPHLKIEPGLTLMSGDHLSSVIPVVRYTIHGDGASSKPQTTAQYKFLSILIMVTAVNPSGIQST
jgi:hypothetical protein